MKKRLQKYGKNKASKRPMTLQNIRRNQDIRRSKSMDPEDIIIRSDTVYEDAKEIDIKHNIQRFQRLTKV